MIDKQDKYFEKDIKDFVLVQEGKCSPVNFSSGEDVVGDIPIFSSEEDVIEQMPMPEIVLTLKNKQGLNLTDYVVLRINPYNNMELLIKKEDITPGDRIGIMMTHGIPLVEQIDYLKEDINSFFDRFKIR
jgi:hypothetical protein